MVGVGRDFWASSGPTRLPKQAHLQQAAEDFVQAGFEYLQRRRLHNPSLGNLFQGSVTLRVKKFFLMFSWNFLHFSLCPLPLVLSLGTTETRAKSREHREAELPSELNLCLFLRSCQN